MALTAPERDAHAGVQACLTAVEEAFAAFDAVAPEGWRVELIEGEIHVVPPANGEHEEIVSEVVDQVSGRRRNKDLRNFTGIGLRVPGASVSGKVIPDLVVAPRGSFHDTLEYHDPDPVLLVCEVTSESTARNDRVEKPKGYARAGIPCYLLIDRDAGLATIYSEPQGERYTRSAEVEFSMSIRLPYPLDFELDTSQF